RTRRDHPSSARGEAAQVGARHPLKSRGLVRSGDGCDPAEGFRFVSAHQAEFPIATMCRVLGISCSGYYAWRTRSPSRRACSNTALTETLRTIHTVSRGTYGAPRVHAELVAGGGAGGTRRSARGLWPRAE